MKKGEVSHHLISILRLQYKVIQAVLDFLLGNTNIQQSDLRLGMVQDCLQLGNILRLLIKPIAESFPHGMGTDTFLEGNRNLMFRIQGN